MRLKYKGYILVADKSFEREQVIACIFSLPSYDSVYEEWVDLSPSKAIIKLKQKVNELITN